MKEKDSAIADLEDEDKKVKEQDDEDASKQPDKDKKAKEDFIGDLGKAIFTDIEHLRKAWKDMKTEAGLLEKEAQDARKGAEKPEAVQRASKGLGETLAKFGALVHSSGRKPVCKACDYRTRCRAY